MIHPNALSRKELVDCVLTFHHVEPYAIHYTDNILSKLDNALGLFWWRWSISSRNPVIFHVVQIGFGTKTHLDSGHWIHALTQNVVTGNGKRNLQFTAWHFVTVSFDCSVYVYLMNKQISSTNSNGIVNRHLNVIVSIQTQTHTTFAFTFTYVLARYMLYPFRWIWIWICCRLLESKNGTFSCVI